MEASDSNIFILLALDFFAVKLLKGPWIFDLLGLLVGFILS